MKTVLFRAGLLAAVTFGGASAALAQGYFGEPAPYGSSLDYSPGMNDLTPGYHSSPYAGDYDAYGSGNPYRRRGGPGPRVGNGTGMGIGAER